MRFYPLQFRCILCVCKAAESTAVCTNSCVRLSATLLDALLDPPVAWRLSRASCLSGGHFFFFLYPPRLRVFCSYCDNLLETVAARFLFFFLFGLVWQCCSAFFFFSTKRSLSSESGEEARAISRSAFFPVGHLKSRAALWPSGETGRRGNLIAALGDRARSVCFDNNGCGAVYPPPCCPETAVVRHCGDQCAPRTI